MERLWAPWRMKYVAGPKRSAAGCVFCTAPAGGEAADHLLARGRTCYSLLNAYPYNNGHLMVIPYAHASELSDVSPEARAEMMEIAASWSRVIAEAMGAEGFNIGFNLGAAAGAGIAEHLHLHIVPRWLGDTNLMPVVGGTKVLPEDLDTTAAKLRAAWVKRFGDE